MMRKNGLASGFRYYGPETCALLIDDLGLQADPGTVYSVQNTFRSLGKDPTVSEIYLAVEAYNLSKITGACTVGDVSSHSGSLLGLWHDFIGDSGFKEPPSLTEAAIRSCGCTQTASSVINRSAFPSVRGIMPSAFFSAGDYTLSDFGGRTLPTPEKLYGECRTVFRPAEMPPRDFSESVNRLCEEMNAKGLRFSVRSLTPNGFLSDFADITDGGSVYLRNQCALSCPEDALHVLGSGAVFAFPAGTEAYFDSMYADFGLTASDIIKTLSGQTVIGVVSDADALVTDSQTVKTLCRGPVSSLCAEIPDETVCEELPVVSEIRSDIRAFGLRGNIYESLSRIAKDRVWAIGGRLSPFDTDAVPAIISIYEYVRNTGNPPVCADFTPGKSTCFTVFAAGKDI